MNSLYASTIIEATGCTPEEVPKIEDAMRHAIFMSTLDSKTKEELVEGAKIAYEVLKSL